MILMLLLCVCMNVKWFIKFVEWTEQRQLRQPVYLISRFKLFYSVAHIYHIAAQFKSYTHKFFFRFHFEDRESESIFILNIFSYFVYL